MIPDGSYTAVVDETEESLVSLEISGDDDRYNLVVNESDLPEAGRHVNAFLRITVEDGAVTEAEYDAVETEQRIETAQDRFDRLSKRPPGSDDATSDPDDESEVDK